MFDGYFPAIGVTSAVVDEFFGAAPRRLRAMAIQRRFSDMTMACQARLLVAKVMLEFQLKNNLCSLLTQVVPWDSLGTSLIWLENKEKTTGNDMLPFRTIFRNKYPSEPSPGNHCYWLMSELARLMSLSIMADRFNLEPMVMLGGWAGQR